MLEKTMLLDEHIFLSLDVSKLFVEHNLDILYLTDFDSLFAVSTIILPTNENPFIRFTGFLINDYRITREASQQLKNKLKKRMEYPMQEFSLQTDRWFFMKDKMALDNLYKKKN